MAAQKVDDRGYTESAARPSMADIAGNAIKDEYKREKLRDKKAGNTNPLNIPSWDYWDKDRE